MTSTALGLGSSRRRVQKIFGAVNGRIHSIPPGSSQWKEPYHQLDRKLTLATNMLSLLSTGHPRSVAHSDELLRTCLTYEGLHSSRCHIFCGIIITTEKGIGRLASKPPIWIIIKKSHSLAHRGETWRKRRP